jgi:hypothetical protein
MAEVQTTTNSGEVAQRFVEFVMMQAQHAALFLGQIPNPQSGKAEVNLEMAKMFIDQLAMIQEKTRGNLSNEEGAVLRNTLASLQLAYVEVARGGSSPAPFESGPAPSAPADSAPSAEPSSAAEAEAESRKKFTKSYGS